MKKVITITKTLDTKDGTKFFGCDESTASQLIKTYTRIGYNVVYNTPRGDFWIYADR